MEKLSCQYFLLDDQVSIEMFSQPNFGYNIDYVDSSQRRHSRVLIENRQEIPVGTPIRDYSLEFIPTDPEDIDDGGDDVFSGYINGDAAPPGKDQSTIDKLTDSVIYMIGKHLVDKTAYLVEPEEIDSRGDCIAIDLINKHSEDGVARIMIAVHPDNSYAVDFIVYSRPEDPLESRMQDAQFSAELFGLLLVALDRPNEPAHRPTGPRYQLKVGYPEPLRMGPLEYAVIEGYGLLGQYLDMDELPVITGKLELEELESELASYTPDIISGIALTALVRARASGQFLSTQLLKDVYKEHQTKVSFEAMVKGI